MLGFPIGVWMGALPDPPNSPAHFTLTLAFTEMCIPATGVSTGCWIGPFNNVMHSRVRSLLSDEHTSLVPFHRLSPPCPSIPPSKVFRFVCSFPLHEDLTTSDLTIWTNLIGRPLPQPAETHRVSRVRRGGGGIHFIARRLLDLPNALHFMKIMTLVAHQ